jgi:hypothetical protein
MSKKKISYIKVKPFSKFQKIKSKKERYNFLRKLGYDRIESKRLSSFSYENFKLYHDLRSQGFPKESADLLLYAYRKSKSPKKLVIKLIEKRKKKIKELVNTLSKIKKISKRTIVYGMQRSNKSYEELLGSGTKAKKWYKKHKSKK